MAEFGKPQREQFLEEIRRGMRRGLAADALRIQREIVHAYAAEHPEFEDAIKQAERDANEPVEDALYQAAVSGNVTAISLWLLNRAPDRWRPPGKTTPGAESPADPDPDDSPEDGPDIDELTEQLQGRSPS